MSHIQWNLGFIPISGLRNYSWCLGIKAGSAQCMSSILSAVLSFAFPILSFSSLYCYYLAWDFIHVMCSKISIKITLNSSECLFMINEYRFPLPVFCILIEFWIWAKNKQAFDSVHIQQYWGLMSRLLARKWGPGAQC